MKSLTARGIFVISVFILSAAVFAEDKDNAAKGRELYLGEKFKCYTCHGKEGEGGMGPSFKGIGKNQSVDEILQKASHRCPPTKQCNPKEIGAIVNYLRTL
ncbi:MAG: Cytochrome c protein [Deltaproteobacteria bacterium]|nr:Cytochrome c protein [Deltaproteobacteria bacterium]